MDGDVVARPQPSGHIVKIVTLLQATVDGLIVVVTRRKAAAIGPAGGARQYSASFLYMVMFLLFSNILSIVFEFF